MAMKIFHQIQRDEFQAIFEHIVEDDGTVSTDDLYQAVMDLGWFPTEAAVAEAVQMVDKDGSGEIDFDEFVLFMQYLRKTEGFTQAEIEEFQRLFNKFDIEGSAERYLQPGARECVGLGNGGRWTGEYVHVCAAVYGPYLCCIDTDPIFCCYDSLICHTL